MPILVVVTFGDLSFWLTPLLVLLIRSIQQRHAYLFKCRYDSIELEATLLVIPLLLEPARSQREQSIGS